MAPGLSGNELLLETRQQQFPFCQRQTKTSDIAKIIRSVDCHDVGGLVLAVSPNLHQPHNPSHASILGQRLNA